MSYEKKQITVTEEISSKDLIRKMFKTLHDDNVCIFRAVGLPNEINRINELFDKNTKIMHSIKQYIIVKLFPNILVYIDQVDDIEKVISSWTNSSPELRELIFLRKDQPLLVDNILHSFNNGFIYPDVLRYCNGVIANTPEIGNNHSIEIFVDMDVWWMIMSQS